MIIKRVAAREICDSRGEKTISVRVNSCDEASSPFGKSRGIFESAPYRFSLKWNIDFLNKWDEDIEINNFEDLIKVEKKICQLVKINDARLFGANALYAFESAILKALAKQNKKKLWEVVNPKARRFPYPVGNVLGGGMHSSGFKEHPDFQEFLIIPRGRKFSQNVGIMKEIHRIIKKVSDSKRLNDEGACILARDDTAALSMLSKVKSDIENKVGIVIDLGIDVAGSTIYNKNRYHYRTKGVKSIDQINYMLELIKNFGIFYVEDPLHERDFFGFNLLMNKTKAMIVGDDLVASQPERLARAIKEKAIRAIIVKPNQHGSLLSIKSIIQTCKENNIKTIMSHRSGETMDDALADYAFGFETDYIKAGIATKYREAKLNRMIEIEKSFTK